MDGVQENPTAVPAPETGTTPVGEAVSQAPVAEAVPEPVAQATAETLATPVEAATPVLVDTSAPATPETVVQPDSVADAMANTTPTPIATASGMEAPLPPVDSAIETQPKKGFSLGGLVESALHSMGLGKKAA